MKNIFLIFPLVCTTAFAIAQATLAPVDADSKVHFTIKNFGINTGGDFSGLKGSIRFDPKNAASSNIDITVNATTINTDNKKRDNHLRQEEYFNSAKYPVLHFKSTKVSSNGKEAYFAEGNITIKGVSKTVSFPFKAAQKNGGWLFECLFELNRRDFGVGGKSAVLGDNLKVTLAIFAK